MSTKEAEQDVFAVTVIQAYAPFFKWLQAHGIVQFAAPGFEPKPATNK